MRWRVRLLRLLRNKAKGPLFTVFTMCCVLFSLSILQSLLSGAWPRPLSDAQKFEAPTELENLMDLIDSGQNDRLITKRSEGLGESIDPEGDLEAGKSNEDAEDGDRDVMDFVEGDQQAIDAQMTSSERVNVDGNLTCTTHVMFMADSQLGNFMVKYAVLYAFQKKFGAKAYLFPKQQRFAKKIFVHLSIPVVPEELKTADWRPVSYEDIMYMMPCNKYVAEQEFFIVTDWPEDNGIQLYSQYVSELRNEYLFTPAVRTRARRYTERFRSSPNTTLVGIHLRRGDHILHTWLRHRRKVPDLGYFNKSMEYFAAMFPEVRFVACSDDRRYLLNKLVPEAPYPVFTIEGLSQVHDMALLAACDHTIITVGTFGLFSGLLTGGSIVSAARHPGTRGDPFDVQVNPPGDVGNAFLWN